MSTRSLWASPLILVLSLLVIAVVWDLSGMDMALAQHMGSPAGFPLRDDWWMRQVFHDAARAVAWGLGCALAAGTAWPIGPLRKMAFERRVQLALSVLVATGTVALVRATSHTSCPWDLADFGGLARYQPRWSSWFVDDGGPGHCFPASHAAVGFAFVAGWFALRRDVPAWAGAWLAGALFFGLFFGLVQQLRGAHFMSHTLWTAAICAGIGWVLDIAFTRWLASEAQAMTSRGA